LETSRSSRGYSIAIVENREIRTIEIKHL